MNYGKSFVEVDEILKYLSQDDFNKIPEDVIKIIRENKDKNYIWKYDKTKKLKDQNIDDVTVAILSYINIEYLLNDSQKKFILNVIN